MINEDFNPVEVWNQAMDKLAEKNREVIAEIVSVETTETADVIETEETVTGEPAIQNEVKLTPSEISKKSAATLLARNPNYYKELAAKARAKKLEMMNQDK